MLQVHDIRESRVYQEARDEGLKEGREQGTARAIARMAAKKMFAEEIAALLDLETVRQVLATVNGN